MQKKLIGAQISALLGSSPDRFHYSCGMTGERRDIDKDKEITHIEFGHGIDPLSGLEVHSPALIEFDGELCITTTGALAAGNLGTRMTRPEAAMFSGKYLMRQGCKIIGPDGKEIKFD